MLFVDAEAFALVALAVSLFFSDADVFAVAVVSTGSS